MMRNSMRYIRRDYSQPVQVTSTESKRGGVVKIGVCGNKKKLSWENAQYEREFPNPNLGFSYCVSPGIILLHYPFLLLLVTGILLQVRDSRGLAVYDIA